MVVIVTFYKYHLKSGRFEEADVVSIRKCEPPKCVPVEILPMDKIMLMRNGRKELVISKSSYYVRATNGRAKRRYLVVAYYNPNKVSREKVPRMLKSKKFKEQFLREVEYCAIVNSDGKLAEKEVKEFLKSLGLSGIRKGSSNAWSIVFTKTEMKLTYPRYLSTGEAYAKLLLDEDTRKVVKELVSEVRKNTTIEKGIQMYGDGFLYFRGKRLKVYYKKSSRPGVKFDPGKGRVIIRGKTLTEAKKELLRFMHSEVLKFAEPIVRKFAREHGVDLVLSHEPPKRSSKTISYVPFGRTVASSRGSPRLFARRFEIQLRPELYLLEEWKWKHILAHELAHVLDLSKTVFLNDHHGPTFYKFLNEILKKEFPDVYKKEKKALGRELRSVEDEEKLIGHNLFVDDSIRKLKPIKA